MYLDGGGEDFATEEDIALRFGQSLEVELDCFLDVGERFFESLALGLATLEFGAPSVEAVLVLLDYHAGFSTHILV